MISKTTKIALFIFIIFECFRTISFADQIKLTQKRQPTIDWKLHLPYPVWGALEYQHWNLKEGPLDIPLVTTSSQSDQGILGQPTTHVIYGLGSNNDEIKLNDIPGLKLTLGTWLDCAEHYGIEFNSFWLDRKNSRSLVTTDDYPFLAIPFYDTTRQIEAAQILASSGFNFGSTWFNESSRMWGTELNGIQAISYCDNWKFKTLLGLQFLDLDETLTMTAKRRFLTNTILPYNSELITNDYFGTWNHFYGVQLGEAGTFCYHGFIAELVAKLGLGCNDEMLDINGKTTTIFFGTGAPELDSEQGSFFALPSHSGTFHHQEWVFVPQVSFKLAYQITSHIKPYLGYDWFFISKVIRPGDQIDRHVNPAEFPPQSFAVSATSPSFQQSSFWAQGVNAGIEISY